MTATRPEDRGGQLGEAHRRCQLLGPLPAPQPGQQPHQPADPGADGQQVQPLHQQVDAPQGRRPGRVPDQHVQQHRDPGGHADDHQPPGLDRPRLRFAAQAGGQEPDGHRRHHHPDDQPQEPLAGGGVEEGPEGSVDAGLLGQEPGDPAGHGEGGGHGQQHPCARGEDPPGDGQAGDGHADQQGEPGVEGQPGSGGRGRRGLGRALGGRLGLGRCRRGGDADPEGERAGGDVAVVLGDDPPADRVGAVGQVAEGDRELQRLPLDRGALALLDRLAAGVEHLNAGEAGLGPLGEGEDDPAGRLVE